ncbi:Hypothetical_protein [Hexamita inflata]|uniref:Hypothetical_protein n=1 Tax=Hexamita inflata TaxID=28002 RepID=A0ABP1J6M4_9EUKA
MTCHLQVQRISDYDSDMKAVRLTTAVQALLWILRDILQQDTILITQKTLCHFSSRQTCVKIELTKVRKEGSSTQIHVHFIMEAYLNITEAKLDSAFVGPRVCENEFRILRGSLRHLAAFSICFIFQKYTDAQDQTKSHSSILSAIVHLVKLKVSQSGFAECTQGALYFSVNSALLKQSKQNIFSHVYNRSHSYYLHLQQWRYTTESAFTNIVHISVTSYLKLNTLEY